MAMTDHVHFTKDHIHIIHKLNLKLLVTSRVHNRELWTLGFTDSSY